MINSFVFNLKQFREGIISSNNEENRQNITLKLSFREMMVLLMNMYLLRILIQRSI